ncbi:MAG: iron-containing alcohol dehydrogenase [Methylococcaceae bacterium]|nr:iron-containing alcohol dehydrogenase [Methylococcaceae bacterium]
MSVFKILVKIIPIPKPTLFTGAGSSLELCSAIAQMGTRIILIVTDSMLVKIGLLDEIKKSLSQHGVEYVIYDGVEPDPTYDQVEAGLSLLKENNCEAILAVGGGSPLDAAKVISISATNHKPINKLAGWFKVRQYGLPFFAIPTTAGTGSEVTFAAVVSDPVTHQKTPVIDPKTIPMMAALDGTLMTGLPQTITAETGMDALTHAIEAYISNNSTNETDRYAIAATRIIMTNLPKVVNNGHDSEARQNMAMASCYAGMAFTKTAVGYVHAIAHQLGAYYQTPHGRANAIVLPYILDYSQDAVTDRLAQLAIVSGLQTDKETNQQLAQKFINHIRTMLKQFNIPEQLEALKKVDIPLIAKAALKEAHFNYPVPKYMDQSECEKLLYKMTI